MPRRIEAVALKPPSATDEVSDLPRSLVDLSDELQIKVIDCLLQQDEEDHAKQLKGWREDEAHIDNPECDDDFEHHPDLVNWSSTSSYFRNLLAPYIFKKVKLRNDDKSGASIDALLKGPHGPLISELYFIGTILDASGNPDRTHPLSGPAGLEAARMPEEAQRIDDDLAQTPPMLSASVFNILSDLSQISNLKSLSIGFTYPYRHTFEDALSSESSTNKAGRAWRILISSTYSALAANEAPHFNSLELRYWVFTYTAPFESPQFHGLLNKLENFTISIRGGTHAAGSNINTTPEYVAAIPNLDSYFFDHLKTALSLTIEAPESGPIGLSGGRFHAPLALRTHQMPLLRSMNLAYIFICPELLAFITSHACTLEVLVLRNCAASVDDDEQADGLFYWKDLFAGMKAAHLPKLHHLEIAPRELPLVSEDSLLELELDFSEEEIEEIEQARRLLEERGTKRRVFSYVELDEKYGMYFHDEDENRAAFQRGEDQAAYEKVVRMVEEAASMSGQSLVLP